MPAALSLDALLVLAIVGVVIGLFLSGIVRVDVVAVLVLAMLGLAHVLTFEELFSGFSSSAVIALLSIMILSAGLERAGFMQRVSSLIVRYGDKSEWRVTGIVCTLAGLIAGFLQNFGAVVLFLPIVNRISLRTGISKTRLLMPMSFCAILGSTTTLIGSSPLIILNDLLAQANLPDHSPLHFFTPLPIGLTLLTGGVLFFLTFGSRVFPDDKGSISSGRDSMSYFQATYGVGGELFELKVTKDSTLQDLSLRHFEDPLPTGLSIVGVYYKGQSHMPPLRRTKLPIDSIIAVMGDKQAVKEYAEQHKLQLSKAVKILSEMLNPAQAGLAEVVIPPNSTLIGKDYRSLHMRRNHEMQVLAVLRGNKVRKGDELREIAIRAGDTLSIFTRWDRLLSLEHNRDFVVITGDYPKEKVLKKKLPHALACALLGIVIAALVHIPIALSLFTGAVAMMLLGILNIDEIYEAISWKTIFLIAGLIPLGTALQKTGAAEWLANLLLNHVHSMPLWVWQLLLALFGTLFTLVVSNVGATVLLVPISIQFARHVGGDPYMFALTVALACNNAFLFPTHQANALIAGAGKYHHKDFLRVGSVVSLFFIVVMVGILQIMTLLR